MAYLDAAYGKVDPPDLYAPDIPEECPGCQCWLDQLDENGCCPECGERLEP